MIASSWLDPVLGIDMHWEMVPTPAPVPMPFPHPFIGIVVDVGGLVGSVVMSGVMSAVFGAPFTGPVLNWFLPATNTGTSARHVPGHFIIPPGTIWAPVPRTPKPKIHPGEKVVPAPPVKPENDAVAIFGSKTVLIGGSNAVRLGDLQLSCSEPVRLPSSVTLAIPKGAPILIGGPPSLDVMAAIQGSLRTRFVSDSLHALVSRLKPGRFRNLLNRTVCFFTGHPVDVASGKVMTSAVDAELPGPLPLRIERVYSSAFGDRDGPLGHGWSLSLDQAIWTERGKVVLLAEDGREIEFDTFDCPEHRMRPGDEVWQPIERLTLACLEGGRWRVTASDGVAREFGPVAGRSDGRAMIQSTRSRCGHHDIAYEYDAQGRLEWVRDACGRLVWLAHDAAGRLAALKLPVPSGEGWYTHRKYAYDAQGDLVQVTDALGHSWRLEYVTHLLVRETDRTGLSFHFEYDGLGQDAWCTRTWGDGGIHDHRLAYDKVKKVTFVTDSLGHTTRYRMNLAGLVVERTDPLSARTRFEHDPRTLQKVREEDPLGNVRTWRFDDRGRCVEVSGPAPGSTAFRYDDEDRMVEAVDPCGGRRTWEYSGVTGIVTREQDPRGGWTEYRSRGGLVRAILSPGGRRTELEFDAQKNPTRLRDPDGVEARFRYDALGRAVGIVDGAGNERKVTYDLEDRVLEVREPDGGWRRFAHDAEGNLITYTDLARHVVYRYSGFHRLAGKDDDDAQVRFEHDTEGRLVGVVDELGQRMRFVRDERGDIVEEIGFEGGTRRYRRDVAGRVVVEVRPSGATTRFTRDHAGRVVELAHSDGTTEKYGYGVDGLLAWAENEVGTVELQRDVLGNVIREVQAEGAVRSTYDPLGRRALVESSQDARISVIRSPAGRVDELVLGGVDGPPVSARFRRDSSGAEIERRVGEVTARWDRDAVGRPRALEVVAAGHLATRREYTWQGDRIRAIGDPRSGATRYVHDGRGRLVAAEDSRVRAWRALDAAGNPYRSPQLRDRSYGPGGRLLAVGETTYAYDPDGNLLEKRSGDGATWRYRWRGAGELAEVIRPDGGAVTFEYDALGRRVRKRTLDGETRFVWDGNTLLQELSSKGRTTWCFEPGTFAPVLQEDPGGRHAVVTDHLGVPTELYDQAGVLAFRLQLDLFGAGRRDVERAACPWRWPGQYEDPETGLHYSRFRYYDPEAGTFISEDPIRLAGGLNLRAYPSDPLIASDPFGLAEGKYGTWQIHSPGYPDVVQKGLHFYAPKGVELSVRPTFDGGITFSHAIPNEAGSAKVKNAIAAALEHFEKDAGFRADILAKATEGRLSVLDFAATYEKNGKLTLRDLANGRSWEMRRIEQNIKKMQETEGGGCT